LSDSDDISIMPSLEEAPAAGPSFSSSGIDTLFSPESMGMMLAKSVALEAFINAAVHNSTFNEFIREILITIMNVVKSEAGSVFEADHGNRTFFFRSVVGSSSDRVVNFSIPFGQGIVGHVAESKLPLNVENAPENKTHLKSIEKAVGFETRNLIAVPILVRGRIYGVLELLNRIGEPNFSSADSDLLVYLCQMAAKTIELRMMIAWARTQDKEKKSGDQAA
jgi:signal transduction protein with GAF and PtsI domain